MHLDNEIIFLDRDDIELLGLEANEDQYPKNCASDLFVATAIIEQGIVDALSAPPDTQRGLHNKQQNLLQKRLRIASSLKAGLSEIIEADFADELNQL